MYVHMNGQLARIYYRIRGMCVRELPYHQHRAHMRARFTRKVYLNDNDDAPRERATPNLT